MDGRPEQKSGCVGESEAKEQTARGVGAADGAGNTVIDIWCSVKRRLFFTAPFIYIFGTNSYKRSVRVPLERYYFFC